MDLCACISVATMTKHVINADSRWTQHITLVLALASCISSVSSLEEFPLLDKSGPSGELQSTVIDGIGLANDSLSTEEKNSLSGGNATSEGTNFSNDSRTRNTNQAESKLRDSGVMLFSNSSENPDSDTATDNSINRSSSSASSQLFVVDFPASLDEEGDSAFLGPKNNTEIGFSDPKAMTTTMRGVTAGHTITESLEINITLGRTKKMTTAPKIALHDALNPQNSAGSATESVETKRPKEPLLDNRQPNNDSAKTFGLSKGRSLDENLLNITVNPHLNDSQYPHDGEYQSNPSGREITDAIHTEDSKIFYIEPADKKREKEEVGSFDDILDGKKNVVRKSKSLGSVFDIHDEKQPTIDRNEFHFVLPSRDTDHEIFVPVVSNSSKPDETKALVNVLNLPKNDISMLAPTILETADSNTSAVNRTNSNSNDVYKTDSKPKQTSEGSIGATEFFIRILKENQVMRTILKHITNNTARSVKPTISHPKLTTKRSKQLDQTTVQVIETEVETTSMKPSTNSPNSGDEATILGNLSSDTKYLSSDTNKSAPDSSETIIVIGSQDQDWKIHSLSNSSTIEIPRENSSSPINGVNYTVSYDFTDSERLTANESLLNVESNDDHGVYNQPQPMVSHNEEDYEELDQSLGSSIRKCCGPAQFFSLDTQACAESGGETNFRPLLHELVLGDTGAALVLMPGRLQICPGTGKPPEIQVGISNYTHLLDQGFLYDIATAVHYDHGVYCLELVGHDSQDSQLTAAICPSVVSEIPVSTIRKCCPLEEYYDTVLQGCAPKPAGMKSISDLVHDFSGSYTESTSIETGRLTCQEGAPDLVDASKVYLGSSDQLCVSQTGRCYPSTLYCIEYMWSPDDYHEQPSAVFCPLDSFQKCCPPDQIVMDDMCVDSHVEYLSPFITQLMATLNYQVGFPIHNNEVCVHLLLDTQDEIRWWVTNSGFLVVDSDNSQMHTKNYCVDDSLEPSGEVITLAHVCSNELKQSIVLPLSVFEKGTIGKCCQPDHHLSPMHQDCAPGGSFNQIEADPLLKNASITALGYTGYPHCQSGIYHLYTFTKKTEDHVEFGEDSKLHVVSLDGQCIERATPVEISDFCVDYGWDAEDPELPVAIVCAPEWENNELHTEKYNLTAALLGVSCFSLLLALINLISMRVRRGLVTIKKMNTLAGRILISYVTAHLIGFLTLAVSMHIDVQDNTASCMLIAAVMQFFLLAGFHWNTSICSESLLLTLRVTTTEGRRFVYHSLWAWGVPALITFFSLIMDSFRHSLPCGTITPRIGRFKCFFSDPDAALLYFYLPIALTLVANLVLLITSRTARLSKLKRLERGHGKTTGNAGTVSGGTQATRKTSLKNNSSGGSGGMRTHQNRNLWSESLRLVLWSGGTWLFEVIGFVAARYISPPQERWYDYLWYLPAAINSLRGFGIFFILVMTPENRTRIVRAIGTVRGKSTAMFRSDRSKTVRKMSTAAANHNNVSMSINSTGYTVRNPHKQRNMSVATTVTSLPALSNTVYQDVPKPHARVAYSISQVQRQNSTTSSQSSNSETEENEVLENGVVSLGGGRRRSSVAPISLPSVDEEEDDYVETSLSLVPSPKPSPPDSVFIRESES